MGAVRLRNATLLITHAELSSRHGVGALLLKIFAEDPALMVLYSVRLFDGQSAGEVALHLPYSDESARPRLADGLEPHQVERIFCVPHVPDDARKALAAAELTGARLMTTYLLDDQNLFFDGIPDLLMRTLVERSSLCLAGSSILQSGYEAKFGRPFGFLPPVNETRLFAPPDLAAPNNQPRRGVIIGNVWSARVLEELRALIRTTGLPVDWFGNAGAPFIEIDPAELRADGIELHRNLADEPLVERLRGFDYGIMPSGRLGEDPELDWLFRASLPSRLVYMLTTAHLPLVVLGDPETAAGEFVARLGLGVTCPYEPAAFAEAVKQVTDPVLRSTIRDRAARLSPLFASEPVAEWVWRSAEAGRPADDRYEPLVGQTWARTSPRRAVFSGSQRRRFR
jgi:hypothetical protein